MPSIFKALLASAFATFLCATAHAQTRSYDYPKEMRAAVDICISFLQTEKVDATALARNKMSATNSTNTPWKKEILEGPLKQGSLFGPIPHNAITIEFGIETFKRRKGQNECKIVMSNVVGPMRGRFVTPQERAVGRAFFERLKAKGFKKTTDRKGRVRLTDGRILISATSQSRYPTGSARGVVSELQITEIR